MSQMVLGVVVVFSYRNPDKTLYSKINVMIYVGSPMKMFEQNNGIRDACSTADIKNFLSQPFISKYRDS